MSEGGRRRRRSDGDGGGHRRRRRRREEDEEAEEDDGHRRGGGGGGGDGGGLVKQTRACDPQWLINMRAYLGPENRDRTLCYLCRAARHDSAMCSMQAWDEMAAIFRKGQLETDPVVNAWNLSRHFELNIRRPANRHLKRGQTPIPELRAVDIYWHFKKHILEASNEVFETIRSIKEYEDDLLGSARKAIVKADGTMSFAVRKKYTPHLKAVWAEKRMWLSLQPHRLAMYNPTYGINVSDVSAFANKNQNFVQTNVEDYLAKETAKRARSEAGAVTTTGGGGKRGR